jgi:ubiquinone/menaquinone biosynthesis C-methylase UbiE
MEIKDPKIRFSDRAANYRKYRPGYPPGIIAFIVQNCHVDNTWSVADVGSGTGISTKLLMEGLKCRVFSVEPNEKMRKDAENALHANPFYRSVSGSAEATTLDDASVNMVTAFQSFHWFEKEKARREFKRILKEPKYVLFVWNNRAETESDFLKGYEAILQDLPEYKLVNHKNISIDNLRSFIENDEVKTVSYSNLQLFDLEGLKGRFFSSSYTPAFGTQEYYKQITKLESLFQKCNKDGFVEYEYRTEAYLGKMN